MPGGVAPTQVVDRAYDDASLRWAVANIDNDQALYLGLPVGFGDCALMEVSVQVNAIATILADTTTFGPSAGLFDDATTAVPVDVQFSDKWTLMYSDTVHCRIGPDQVQFWKESEVLRVSFEEIDTNATPTGDLTVIAKVKRLRSDITTPAPPEDRFLLTRPYEDDGQLRAD